MLMIVVPVVLIALAVTTIYSISKAPSTLRKAGAVLFTVPTGLGCVVAYIASTAGDGRAYYLIAGAIAGWMVGAVIFDSRRKRAAKLPAANTSSP